MTADVDDQPRALAMMATAVRNVTASSFHPILSADEAATKRSFRLAVATLFAALHGWNVGSTSKLVFLLWPRQNGSVKVRPEHFVDGLRHGINVQEAKRWAGRFVVDLAEFFL